MIYLPPFHIGGTHKVQAEELENAGSSFRYLLKFLIESPHLPDHLLTMNTLNDFKH